MEYTFYFKLCEDYDPQTSSLNYWWQYGGSKLWKQVKENGRYSHINEPGEWYEVPEEQGQDILQRMILIPGWDDGPYYARNPVIVKLVKTGEG